MNDSKKKKKKYKNEREYFSILFSAPEERAEEKRLRDARVGLGLLSGSGQLELQERFGDAMRERKDGGKQSKQAETGEVEGDR